MQESAREFSLLVVELVKRFFAQNGRDLPAAADLDGLAARLFALLGERGLPPPLPPSEAGSPGGMAEAEYLPFVTRVLGGSMDVLLAESATQLVKACFYPEFTKCRNSFGEVAADGSCRRQEVDRARKRVSGSHCVDCPYWLRLAPAAHGKFLAKHWRDGPGAFAKDRGLFLPEDFRALRCWVRARAATSAERPQSAGK